MSQRAVRPAPPGYHYIYVAWFRHPKTGRLVVARHFGLVAFRILVRD